MKKISKSDYQTTSVDKEHETHWDKVSSRAKSKHFTRGSRVLYNNVSGEILAVLNGVSVNETLLRILWEDDTVSNIKPIALNRSTT